jgi:hypothetical protein
VALTEAAAEFLQRHAQRAQQQAEVQCGAHGDLGGRGMDVDAARPPAPAPAAGFEADAGPLPMLASACPGWVCYAEKTHGDHVLPYISTAKSPQAVMGTLVKGWWAPLVGLQPERVYHCAVMPCYDKKLEASRDDFVVRGEAGWGGGTWQASGAPHSCGCGCGSGPGPGSVGLRECAEGMVPLVPPWTEARPARPPPGAGTQVLETDCVLATTELLDLAHLHRASSEPPLGQPAAAAQPDPPRELQPRQQQPLGLGGEELAEELARLSASPLDLPFSNEAPGGARWGVPGGSGGYLEHVFRTAARELYGREPPPGPLPMVAGRNAGEPEAPAGGAACRFSGLPCAGRRSLLRLEAPGESKRACRRRAPPPASRCLQTSGSACWRWTGARCCALRPPTVSGTSRD